MNLYRQQVPYGVALSLGRITGHSTVDKFGENPDVDTGTDPEDIWEGGGLYQYDANGTAPIRYVSSSDSGDTARLIEVTGLDIDGFEVVQQVTTDPTDAQNAVELPTPLWRVYRAQNISARGVDLAGMLYIGTEANPTNGVPDAGNVRAIIDDGNNQTLMALYTIPRGKVGLLHRGEIGMSRNQTSGAARCAYYSARMGKAWAIKKRVDVTNQGTSTYQDERSFPDIVPAMTDIRLVVEEVSANSAGIFGTMDFELIDEDELSEDFLAAIGQPEGGPV